MHFDPTVNLGTVLILCTFLATIFTFATKLGKIETKIDTMWNWFVNGGVIRIESPDEMRSRKSKSG